MWLPILNRTRTDRHFLLTELNKHFGKSKKILNSKKMSKTKVFIFLIFKRYIVTRDPKLFPSSGSEKSRSFHTLSSIYRDGWSQGVTDVFSTFNKN